MDTNEKVLQILQEAGEPLKAGDIADKGGLDKKDVDKAIKALKKAEKIFSPKRCYYSVSE